LIIIAMENQVTTAAKGWRNYWIDLLRLVMALFVVGVHCTRQIGWGSDPNQGMAILNSTIFRTAVPFFFLITSYYVYDRYLASGKKASVFFKSGLRYGAMYIFWIVLYLPIILRESWVGQGKDGWAYFCWFMQEFFLNSPISVFWFMRASAMGLLAMGLLFLYKKMKPIYLLPLALLLYSMGAFGDAYLNGFVTGSLAEVYTSYFKIFYFSRNMMFDALPFFVIGCLIREYQDAIPLTKKANIVIWSLVGVGLIAVFLESWLLDRAAAINYCQINGGYKVKDYNILFSFLIFDPFLFLALLRIQKPLRWKAAPYLADVSSLVYFTHIAFRDAYNDVFANTAYEKNWYLRFALVALFTLFASIAIVATTHNSKLKKWVY
jgi:surface polysaccharide O-acyltransferase-like enzyme